MLRTLPRAHSAEGRRPHTGPEKRSAPRAVQRRGGAVARRGRPPARSLRGRPGLELGASEAACLGRVVFLTASQPSALPDHSWGADAGKQASLAPPFPGGKPLRQGNYRSVPRLDFLGTTLTCAGGHWLPSPARGAWRAGGASRELVAAATHAPDGTLP
jgi:hypothetical protein